MVDHSLGAYLSRRTTAQLEKFLWQCLQTRQWDQYADTIPLILGILKRRGVEMRKDIVRSWEDFKIGQICTAAPSTESRLRDPASSFKIQEERGDCDG